MGFDIYEMCVNAIPGWTSVGVPTIGKCKGTLEALLARRHDPHLPRAAVLASGCARCRTRACACRWSSTRRTTSYQLQSPPGLKEAMLHAQSLYEKTQGGARHQPAGTDLTLPLRRIPGDEPVRHGRRARPLRPLGRRACCTPSRTRAARTARWCSRRATSSSCPTAATSSIRSRLEIREGHIVSIEGGVDAALMRDWLAEGKTGEQDRDPVRRLARRLGPQPAMPLGLARPLRRRARAQPRRGAQLPRQLPVLHRPEHAGRRQAHHARPLRRADARLHDRARRQRRRRGRPHRRPEDERRRASRADRAAPPQESEAC